MYQYLNYLILKQNHRALTAPFFIELRVVMLVIAYRAGDFGLPTIFARVDTKGSRLRKMMSDVVCNIS